MVKRCAYKDENGSRCKKQPYYNEEGETNTLYCSIHKTEDMINLKDKTCIHKDEGKEYKKNISISKIIMDNIIDKRLGSVTYHYGDKKSAKAYHTYDYPEIYYGKKMYSSVTQWLKEEFYKNI